MRPFFRPCDPPVKIAVLFSLLSFPLVGASASEPFFNSIGMKMIPIPAGAFRMGNPTPRVDGWDEIPVHLVRFKNPFFISETEVTVEQFRKFRPDFRGSRKALPYVTGVSWEDAVAFCEWLTEKEGKPYRLPTEAEWEYAARAGTRTPYWSGDQPPEAGAPNPWGLKNVHRQPTEWCLDWYGPYPSFPETDPVGPASGMARVIRGGGLDKPEDPYYARSANRSGYGPLFGMMSGSEPGPEEENADIPEQPSLEGLIGTVFSGPHFDRPSAFEVVREFDLEWLPGLGRGNSWSENWVGVLQASVTGEVTFRVRTDGMVRVTLAGKVILSASGAEAESSPITLQQGENYPIEIAYSHIGTDRAYLRITWTGEGKESGVLSIPSLYHSPRQHQTVEQMIQKKDRVFPGHHSIGFRVVQAPMPPSEHRVPRVPFVRSCVVQDQPLVDCGPDPDKPWFKRRPLLPMPPDNVPRNETRLAGLHPGFMDHNHSPAVEVCPNGDVLLVIYTSEHEYEPEVSLIASRLRFGAEEWDMPEIVFDFPDVNDHAPCLFTEKNTLCLFWGNPRLESAYPFQWMTSRDNGVTWSQVRFPHFVGEIGPHSRQPINTVLRGPDGTLYVSSDAQGGTSVLWATKDDGKTWYDTGGRSAGRHTTYAMLKDGRILGMGGKNTDIDGYMPKAISGDGGQTWKVGKTPFSRLGSNQRPCLIRLKSGRLFFCGDLQHRMGEHPDTVRERGCFVALSEDEGETWHVKKLAGTLPHEKDNLYDTLGYSVARQAPNGVIHLITTMNTPCLHFELNEAWILSETAGAEPPAPPSFREVREFKEVFEKSGKLKSVRRGGVTEDGRFLLHGVQEWYYENGQTQWIVGYRFGQKVGQEIYWEPDGRKVWEWRHEADGTSVWIRYWPNGRKKSESTWRDFKLEGTARRWDRTGHLLSETLFRNGRAVPRD